MNKLRLVTLLAMLALIQLVAMPTGIDAKRRKEKGKSSESILKKSDRDDKDDDDDDDKKDDELDADAVLSCYRCDNCTDFGLFASTIDKEAAELATVKCDPGEICWKGHSLSGEHSRGCASRECVQSSFKSDNEETVSFANNLCCKSDLCNSQTTLHSNQIILACLLALALIC